MGAGYATSDASTVVAAAAATSSSSVLSSWIPKYSARETESIMQKHHVKASHLASTINIKQAPSQATRRIRFPGISDWVHIAYIDSQNTSQNNSQTKTSVNCISSRHSEILSTSRLGSPITLSSQIDVPRHSERLHLYSAYSVVFGYKPFSRTRPCE